MLEIVNPNNSFDESEQKLIFLPENVKVKRVVQWRQTFQDLTVHFSVQGNLTLIHSLKGKFYEVRL